MRQSGVKSKAYVLQFRRYPRNKFSLPRRLFVVCPSFRKPVSQIFEVARCGQFQLALRGELFQCVGSRRFQQTVAQRITVGLGQHQRFIDQRREHIEHVEFVKVIAGAEPGRALQSEPVDKDAETAKEPALPLIEQVVTPVDERAQCLLPRQSVAASAGQHPEPLVEPFAELARTERPHPRCRKFDGKGNAVEPPADVGHDRRVLVGERELLIGAQRALHEECNRRGADRLRCIDAIAAQGNGKRRHPVRLFTRDTEGLAA